MRRSRVACLDADAIFFWGGCFVQPDDICATYLSQTTGLVAFVLPNDSFVPAFQLSFLHMLPPRTGVVTPLQTSIHALHRTLTTALSREVCDMPEMCFPRSSFLEYLSATDC